MVSIRFHGRGGQGTVIASKILAHAFFNEGWTVQAFPSFGAERTGAPVAAFLRADHRPITLRCQITRPDLAVVLDPLLADAVDVTAGLVERGTVIVNAVRLPRALSTRTDIGVAICDATGIASAHALGSRTHPIVNTAMAGAFAAATGLVRLEAVLAAIAGLVPTAIEANCAAARDAAARVSLRTQPLATIDARDPWMPAGV